MTNGISPWHSQVMLGFRSGISVSASGLTLNVDAAATAFVPRQPLVDYIAAQFGMRVSDLRRHPNDWNIDDMTRNQGMKRLKQGTKGLDVEMRSLNGNPPRKLTIFGFSKLNARNYM